MTPRSHNGPARRLSAGERASLCACCPYVGQSISLAVALGAAGAALAVLLWLPLSNKEDENARPGSSAAEDVVHLAGPRRIAIKPGGPLGKKLAVATAESESLSAPLLLVTWASGPCSTSFRCPRGASAFNHCQLPLQIQASGLKSRRL
ncbi:MAG: hypothetical protein HYS12_28180 [Planctomycetes bacterium]|nr:hypothetical protein [Planctomycetota bacterium]